MRLTGWSLMTPMTRYTRSLAVSIIAERESSVR